MPFRLLFDEFVILNSVLSVRFSSILFNSWCFVSALLKIAFALLRRNNANRKISYDMNNHFIYRLFFSTLILPFVYIEHFMVSSSFIRKYGFGQTHFFLLTFCNYSVFKLLFILEYFFSLYRVKWIVWNVRIFQVYCWNIESKFLTLFTVWNARNLSKLYEESSKVWRIISLVASGG